MVAVPLMAARTDGLRSDVRRGACPRSSIADDSLNTAFEWASAEHFGARHALSLSSGSHAILTALLAADIGEGTEVIIGPIGWGQALAAVSLAGGTPVMVDCDAFGGICPEAAAAAVSPDTRAILTVCPNSISDDLFALQRVAREAGILLVNDSSAASAAISAQPADVHCLSLGASKLLSAGEGGLILTEDGNLYERALLLSQHPLRAHRKIVDAAHFSAASEFFLSSRMSPLHARLAMQSLECFAKNLRHRRRVQSVVARKVARILRATDGPGRFAVPRARFGDGARLVFRPAESTDATTAQTLREECLAHPDLGCLLRDREVLLADKLAHATAGWRSPLVDHALRKLHIRGPLPVAIDYCLHALVFDCPQQVPVKCNGAGPGHSQPC